MLKRLLPAVLAVAALALAGNTLAQTPSPGSAATKPSSGSASGASMAGSDLNFVKKAAEGSLAEVELGELARDNAQNTQVREFGERMVKDHTKAGEDLKKVVADKNVALPDKPDKKAMKEKDKLAKKKGADFDREYMSHMVKDHEKDVKEFEKNARSAKDPAVKDFASSTLPTLQEHLKLAQSTQAALKEEKNAKGTATSVPGSK